MFEDPVEHVRDGLEAPMRVPRRALGLARRVLDLAHLIHVDERIEIGEIDAGERSSDRESLALEAAGRRDHRANRTDRGRSARTRGSRWSSVTSSTVIAGMSSSEPVREGEPIPIGSPRSASVKTAERREA